MPAVIALKHICRSKGAGKTGRTFHTQEFYVHDFNEVCKFLSFFPIIFTHINYETGKDMIEERNCFLGSGFFPRTTKGENVMKSNNQMNIPEAKEAMDKFKMQAASEVGVNLKNGYNGNLTSREAGSVGGQMVKKMIESYEQGLQ